MKRFAQRQSPMLKAVQAKRTSAAMRSRTTHERQAEDAAHRFVAGEIGLSRFLTPAPAAGFTLPSSPGEPLATGIRAELEQAFDADLSAVRIHRDQAAAAAARALHARAFTAAGHIFFSSGGYNHADEEGRRLLSHEVGHVLQQTAVAGHNGLKIVQQRVGAGVVQCEEDPLKGFDVGLTRIENYFSDVVSLLQSAKERLTDVDTVMRLHESHSSDSTVKTEVALLRKAVAGKSDAAVAQAIEGAYALRSGGTPSTDLQHLYCDLFKAVKNFDAAAAVFGTGLSPDTTALPLYAYYAARMRANDATWVVRYLGNHPVGKKYYPWMVVQVMKMNFYGPTRGTLNLDPQMRFNETIDAAVREAHGREPLKAGEKEFIALGALRVFDAIRKLPLRVMLYRLRKVKSKRIIAHEIIKQISLFTDPAFLSRLATDVGAEPEVIALASASGPGVAKAAKQAIAYWARMESLSKRIFPGEAKGEEKKRTDELREHLPERWQSIKELRPVEQKLISAVRQAFALPGGALPTPAQYRTCLLAGVRQLDMTAYFVDSFLPGMLKKALAETAEAETLPPELVAGLALKLIWELRDHVAQYEPPAAKDERERILARDSALKHRVEMAQLFFTFATWFGMEQLRVAAARVALGQELGLKKSYIALLGDFERRNTGDLRSDLEQFRQQFPSTLAGFPLTGSQLVDFTHALYYGSLADTLNDLLNVADPATGTREQRFDLERPLINEAMETLNDFRPPQCFSVPPGNVIQYIADSDAQDVSRIVSQDHPVIKKLYALATADDVIVTPMEREAHRGGYVMWIVPGMSKLVERLAIIPEVLNLKLKNGEAVGEPNLKNPWPWLKRLQEAIGLKGAQVPDIAGFVRGELDSEWNRLALQLRRATSNRRRSFLPRIEKTLAAYDTSDLKRRLNTMFKPSEAIELILMFAGEVQPAQDQELQAAALMLELADLLYAKLGPQKVLLGLAKLRGTERLDVVLPLYELLMGAAAYGKNPTNRAELGRVLLAINVGDLGGRVKKLEALAEQFKKTAEEFQQQTVLGGSSARNQLFVPDRGYPVSAGDASAMFTVNGITYTLEAVLKDFQFIPGLAGGISGIAWSDAKSLGASKLKDGDGQKNLSRTGEPLLRIRRTVGEGSEQEVVVRDTDDRLLSELTYAVHMQVVMRQLGDLKKVLEESASFITLGLQVAFPELAGPMAAAEVAGAVMQFVSSPEYGQLKQALDGDVGKLFDQAVTRLKKTLTMEALWDFLLFGMKPSWATLLSPVGMFSRQKRLAHTGSPESSRSALRIFSRIAHAGVGIVRGVDRLHDKFTVPVRKTALWVQGTPWVALVLRTIVNNLYRLQLLNLRELDPTASAADLLVQVQDLYRRVDELIATLSDYHLPDEIIPMNELVLFGMDLFADHLPLKYRAAMKARKLPGIDKAWAKLGELVAKEFKQAGIDPNVVWRTTIRGHMDPYLHAAAREIASEMHGVISGVPFLKGLSPIMPQQVSMGFSGEEFPETPELQLKALPGTMTGTVDGPWPTGNGMPLSAGQHERFASGFGHDFSHVRLHRGETVDHALGRIHAVAATSGSHVFLDSGVSPSSGEGEEVVRHELAHVLQQTGPRPLGVRHDSRPLDGRAGRGVRVERGAEAEADTLARATGLPSGSPRSITPCGPIGVQPALKDIVVKFFNEMGDPAKLIEHVEGKVTIPADAAKLAAAADDIRDSLGERLVDSLAAAGKQGSVVKFATLFREKEIQGDLIAHMLKNRLRREVVKGEVRNLIGASISGKKPAKGGKSSSASQQEVFTLNIGGLEVLLEEYLFARTGVNVDVEFNLDKAAGEGGKPIKKIDASNPFSLLKLNYLHLPMLGGDHSLWDYFITNSFPKIPADKRPLYQAKSRLALLGLKPGPGIYEKKKIKGKTVLAFSKKVRDLVEEYVNPPIGKALPSNLIPPWAEYVETAPQTAVGIHGQIGLRLGFYNQRKAPGNQYGEDRASHHTVQYLLLEYLDNGKGNYRPFPHKLSLYPNIDASGSRVKALTSEPEKRGDRIEIGNNMPDRGGTMPAILIAKHTHQLGNVHISAKADEDEGGASQGAAVHGDFLKHLGPYAAIVSGTSDKGLKAIKAASNPTGSGEKIVTPKVPEVGNMPVTEEMLSTAIFTAACTTYTEMRTTMLQKLMAALNREEMDYYTSAVMSATDPKIVNISGTTREPMPDYKPTALASGFETEVKKHTVDTLESKAFGFKEMRP